MPWDKGDVNRMLPRKCQKLLKSIIRQKNCKKKARGQGLRAQFYLNTWRGGLGPLEKENIGNILFLINAWNVFEV